MLVCAVQDMFRFSDGQHNRQRIDGRGRKAAAFIETFGRFRDRMDENRPDTCDLRCQHRAHSFLPHGFGAKEASKLLVVRGWGIEQGGKTLECLSREREVAPIQQDGFRFPAGGVEHEIGPAFAEDFRCLVDQGFLCVTGAEADGLPLSPHGLVSRIFHVFPPRVVTISGCEFGL